MLPRFAQYGLRSVAYHTPWDPRRPADFWELPVVAARLHAQLAESKAGASLCLFLSLKVEPERVIGVANLRNIIRGALLSAHVGYGLAPDAVGHGYMTEAVDRVVGIAFAEMRPAPRRVQHHAAQRPFARRRRADRLRAGGVLVAHYLRINGRWEDHVRLARLNEDSG